MYSIENVPERIRCLDCKYYNARANLPGVVSVCKILDHKEIQFRISCFASYVCDGPICSFFEPRCPEYADFADWTNPDDYLYVKYLCDKVDRKETPVSREVFGEGLRGGLFLKPISFVLFNETDIWYTVEGRHFYFGELIENDRLKAYEKVYYHRCKSGFGYSLIREPINGIDLAKLRR